MKIETLERALEIKRNLEQLEELRHIMLAPHPEVENGSSYISLISVGEAAEKDIKESVIEAIKRNRQLLEKELEAL